MNLTTLTSLLGLILTVQSLNAQPKELVDSVFRTYMEYGYVDHYTDTLPNLFYHDSVLITIDDLKQVKSITDESNFIPFVIWNKERKLVEWNEITPRPGTRSVHVMVEEKWFNKYDITISIPVLNPRGHEREGIRGCSDTHYIVRSKYAIKQKKGGFEILNIDLYCFLYTHCI